jgi:hypothetical protein
LGYVQENIPNQATSEIMIVRWLWSCGSESRGQGRRKKGREDGVTALSLSSEWVGISHCCVFSHRSGREVHKQNGEGTARAWG